MTGTGTTTSSDAGEEGEVGGRAGERGCYVQKLCACACAWYYRLATTVADVARYAFCAGRYLSHITVVACVISSYVDIPKTWSSKLRVNPPTSQLDPFRQEPSNRSSLSPPTHTRSAVICSPACRRLTLVPLGSILATPPAPWSSLARSSSAPRTHQILSFLISPKSDGRHEHRAPEAPRASVGDLSALQPRGAGGHARPHGGVDDVVLAPDVLRSALLGFFFFRVARARMILRS